MNFVSTPLPGAFLIEPQLKEDERGFFARTWCQREFAEHGLASRLVQCSISFNRRRGTVRGMHWQVAPMAEAKLVRVTQGRAYDVIVDLRAGSDTFLKWFGAELTQFNRLALYVPEGFAHGFETLADDTEVYYQMSEFHSPAHARGFRWNDDSVGIVWPETLTTISERDCSYPNLSSELLAEISGR